MKQRTVKSEAEVTMYCVVLAVNCGLLFRLVLGKWERPTSL